MLVLGIVLLGAGLALVTRLGVGWIERAHPATGRMIDVPGARLHVVELGAAHADPAQPPIVMIHGASANLEALRAPLGERLAARHRVILIDRPGHGWSTRDSLDDSTPARQARMIADALTAMGIPRAVVLAHSWGGALGAAFALAYPERTAGLVLLAPVTHRWPGGVAWYNHVAALPVLGPVFAHTLALPIGLAMTDAGARATFAPQPLPENYVRATAVRLLLRPHELQANARDMLTLKEAVTAQSARYGAIATPTLVITGDRDVTVSPDIHSRAFAATVPGARLVMLPGVGHVPQNAAPDRIAAEVDDLFAVLADRAPRRPAHISPARSAPT